MMHCSQAVFGNVFFLERLLDAHQVGELGGFGIIWFMDIRVLDHLIVGDNNCLSFAERGLP